MPRSSDVLEPFLVEQVLERLGLSDRPTVSLDGLAMLYAAWGQRVPFDNIRKLIHLRRNDPGPLPGSAPADFFDAWLRYGAGATCWAGNGALHALLCTLGFSSVRGYATMLLAPDIPPNHATVVVWCDGRRYLVDASILHGEPLELLDVATSRVAHPAWGVEADPSSGQHIVRWRPIHMPEGLGCRIDRLDVSADTFHDFHERSRPWSPFNYQLYARVNRMNRVIGTGFGQRFEFGADGTVHQQALEPRERLRFLVEEVGIHESLAAQVPVDIPTPPPPTPPMVSDSGRGSAAA